MRVEIEESKRFELGKTLYSIDSLRDWFLVRRMFVDPMTNLVIRGSSLRELLGKLREMDYFPDMDVGHIQVYRVYCIFERYMKLREKRGEYMRKIEILDGRIGEKEGRMGKSGRRSNGERMVEKYGEQIGRLRERRIRLEEMMGRLEVDFEENVNYLVNGRRCSLKIR